MKLSFLFFAITLITSCISFSQDYALRKEWWVPNDQIRSVLVDSINNTVYIAGDFDEVGPPTPFGSAVELISGLPMLNYDSPNGPVTSIFADGNGGWFIGGEFDRVGDSIRSRIAHLNGNGKVSSWSVTSNGPVQSLNYHAGVLFIGGSFDTINGQIRNNLAAVDSTGQLLSWNPNVDGAVLAIEIINNSVFIGGHFTLIGSQNHQFLAEINKTTGVPTSWDPMPTNYVKSLKINNGKLYVGGNFYNIDGQGRNNIAKFDISTNTLTSWNPDINNVVHSITILNGEVFFGGEFTSVNGFQRNYAASVDTVIGTVTNWNPNFGNHVYDILNDGNNIFVAGNFKTVGALNRNYIASIDPISGVAENWDPHASSNIFKICVNDSITYLGGDFSSVGGATRRGIAALNLTTGVVTNWNPNSSQAYIYTLCDNNTSIYVGGQFSDIGGQIRNNIAEIDKTTGLSTSWNPNANNLVWTIKKELGRVFVGGGFTEIGGAIRGCIASLNATSGIADSWNPIANYGVRTLLIKNNKVYFGGEFNQIGGYTGPTRNRIAAVDKNTGLPTSWNPNANGAVWTMELLNDKIYVGGEFTTIGGQLRVGIAQFDTISSLATSWNLNANNSVFSILIRDSILYVGGGFSNIGGINLNALGVFNMNTNSVNNVDFNLNSGVAVPSILSINRVGDKLLLGGNYINVKNNSHPYFSCMQECAPSQSFDTVTSCNNYSWPNQGGFIYTVSGDYTDTLINSLGCDSILNLHLTILPSYFLTETVSICSSYVWPQNNQTYLSSGIYQDTLTSINGCDSIITLNLTILQSSSATETVSACDFFTWPINNQTYTTSGQYIDTISNAAGCDSIITLDLTIIPSLPLTITNTFSLPSDATTCVGELAVSVSGNADYELNVDNGAQIVNTSGYSLINNICPGVHDLLVIDNCGDSLTTQIVIPIDSNYVFNNPFIDSIAVDSLGTTITNCDIYYNQIDTAYIDSIWASGNTVNVIWNIVDSNGSNFDTSSYVLNNGNGVYWLQLSVFCPTKALGDYFTVTEAIYFNDGTISMADLAENTFQFDLYPNPTNNEVTLTFDSNEAQVIVYDTQGKLIQTKSIHSGEQVSLKEVETGVYFFEVITEKGNAVKRVVKD